jgi:glycerol-3-phosphate dehydrogenase (NAD(P)+)
MVVEGIRATLAAHELAQRYGVEMPITEQIYKVLYDGSNPREAVSELMSRGRTHEVEEVAVIDEW